MTALELHWNVLIKLVQQKEKGSMWLCVYVCLWENSTVYYKAKILSKSTTKNSNCTSARQIIQVDYPFKVNNGLSTFRQCLHCMFCRKEGESHMKSSGYNNGCQWSKDKNPGKPFFKILGKYVCSCRYCKMQ